MQEATPAYCTYVYSKLLHTIHRATAPSSPHVPLSPNQPKWSAMTWRFWQPGHWTRTTPFSYAARLIALADRVSHFVHVITMTSSLREKSTCPGSSCGKSDPLLAATEEAGLRVRGPASPGLGEASLGGRRGSPELGSAALESQRGTSEGDSAEASPLVKSERATF